MRAENPLQHKTNRDKQTGIREMKGIFPTRLLSNTAHCDEAKTIKRVKLTRHVNARVTLASVVIVSSHLSYIVTQTRPTSDVKLNAKLNQALLY